MTVGEIAYFNLIVNSLKGRGGFQNLILYLWYQLDENTGILQISPDLLERIHRYAFCYHSKSWNKILIRLFSRTLGNDLTFQENDRVF